MLTGSGKAIVILCAFVAQFDGDWSIVNDARFTLNW